MKGLAIKVQNAHDGKTYLISTCRNPIGLWETGIFEKGGFLRPIGKLVYGICPIGPDDAVRLLTRRFPRFTMADLLTPELTIGRPMKFIPVPVVDDICVRKHHEWMVEIATTNPRELWPAVIREVSQTMFAAFASGWTPEATPEAS